MPHTHCLLFPPTARQGWLPGVPEEHQPGQTASPQPAPFRASAPTVLLLQRAEAFRTQASGPVHFLPPNSPPPGGASLATLTGRHSSRTAFSTKGGHRRPQTLHFRNQPLWGPRASQSSPRLLRVLTIPGPTVGR